MQFINPYNFIGLSEKEPDRKVEVGMKNVKMETSGQEEQKLTGVIHYTLTTHTRLHVPNTTTDKAFSCSNLENQHKSYDFFSYNDLSKKNNSNDSRTEGSCFAPVIPGSEVRGMIRTIYETLTNSCLPVVDNTVGIGRRTVEKFKPGILIRTGDQIALYNAIDWQYRDATDFTKKIYSTERILDGSLVYFRRNRYSVQVRNRTVTKREAVDVSEERKASSNAQGYLLKGEKGPDICRNRRQNKCRDCVHNSPNAAKPCAIAQEGRRDHCYADEKHSAHVFERGQLECNQKEHIAYEGLLHIIKQYQKNADTAPADRKSEYKEYEQTYYKFDKGEVEGIPVYFSVMGEYYMLSPACITREIYEHTAESIIKKHSKCGMAEEDTVSKKEHKKSVALCPACRLFGIVSESVNKGSKIRFSDLQLKEPEKYEKDGQYEDCYNNDLLTLEELSIPKITATEFYLQKPPFPRDLSEQGEEGEVWFWTYDYFTVKLRNGEVRLRTYDPTISGRKFYWHNCTEIENAREKNKRNRTVRTVKPDVEFSGKLYFDGITKKQLDQLMYILQYTSDKKHGYKLGTGKPLGLGSVDLAVSAVVLREYTEEKGYQNVVKEMPKKMCEFKTLGFDKNVESAFKKITSYMDNETEDKIRYPFVENREGGFEWFKNNRKSYRGGFNGDRYSIQDPMINERNPNNRRQTKIIETLPSIIDEDCNTLDIDTNGTADANTDS